MMTKYAMLALFSTSFIALNNCGNQSNSTNEQAYETATNGNASDLAILPSPPAGYPVVAGAELPTVAVETACFDGVDNDGDGRPDGMDTDCHIHPEYAEFGPPLSDIENGRAQVIYPNGLSVSEDIALLKARSSRRDNQHLDRRTAFFATSIKDCWIDPLYQDPYSVVALGERLVASPAGAVGPLVNSDAPYIVGPRRGLIDECDANVFEYHWDDDNGDGAGAGGDYEDDEGGT